MTAILVASALAMGADPAYDRDLLRAVADGHRQARDAIVTLHVTAKSVSTSTDPPDAPRGVQTIEWWQSGPDWRSRESFTQEATPPAKATVPPTRYERLFKGGTIKAVSVWERQGVVGDADWLVTPMSPWHWGLFLIQDRPPIPFADLLKDEKAVLSVASEGEGAKRRVVVEFAREAGHKCRVWFDPSVNYLGRKRVDEYDDHGGRRVENEIEAFREAKPGVFFPVKYVSRYYVAGKLKSQSTLAAEVVEVNEPVADEALTLTFPEGVFIEDTVKGIRYATGPDGKPVPARPARPIPPETRAQVQAPAEPEPVPVRWLWVAATLAAAMCVGLVAWRLLRGRAP